MVFQTKVQERKRFSYVSKTKMIKRLLVGLYILHTKIREQSFIQRLAPLMKDVKNNGQSAQHEKTIEQVNIPILTQITTIL